MKPGSGRKSVVLCPAVLAMCVLFAAAASAQTNIAPSGTGYVWHSMTTSTATTGQTAAAGINNGNLTTAVSAYPAGESAVNLFEGGGVIFSSAQSGITKVVFINGTIDSGGNGYFEKSLALQTYNGTAWSAVSGWSLSPTYPYGPSAGGVTYTYTGAALNNVRGVRVVGVVRSSTLGNSWYWLVNEVQVFTGSSSQCMTATAGGAFQNTSFTSQTGMFTASFDATPSASPIDAAASLSKTTAAAYTDLAGIARFNTSGKIDARNGGAYAAATSVAYSAGVSYHFRLVVNVAAHTYSIYVTPAGGTENTIGTNYAFRTEQNGVTNLADWSAYVDSASSGSLMACNFALGSAADFTISATPSSQTVVAGSGTTYTATVAPLNGFTGAVTPTVSGLPSGATGSFSPSTITGGSGSSALSVTTSGGTPIGSYPLSITGTSGSLVHSAPVTLVVTGSGGSTYNQTIITDHPVAFWGMNQGVSTEADLTGNGNTGLYQGGTPGTTTLPNGDAAAMFNGATEYLTVPSNTSFSISTTGNLTWEMWIKPSVLEFPHQNTPDNYVDVMGKCQDYSGPPADCEWESRMYSTTTGEGRPNRMSAYVFNLGAGLGSAADWQPVNNLIQANHWYHIVGEYTTAATPSGCSTSYPGGINIWVDGVKWNMSYHSPTGCMSQYNIAPHAGPSPLNIGSMAFDSWFDGAIGKVAIYNYLLTPAQIANHYQVMTGSSPTGSCANTCTF